MYSVIYSLGVFVARFLASLVFAFGFWYFLDFLFEVYSFYKDRK